MIDRCTKGLCLKLVFGIFFLWWGCTTAPENLSTLVENEFILKEGFEIELIAAEPLLDSPVAMSQDLAGNIWVVELPGYMRDINGSGEMLPDGKIVRLTDTDGDGKMDQRHIFIDSLVAPRALALAYGGLLYTESTKLWWTPIEGQQPGNPILVDSLYVIGGNIEHQPNGLYYNLDNWIYSAKSNLRYRRKNGQWLKEVTSFRGQWGMTSDDEGRLFYNSNSNPLNGDCTTPNQFIENPYLKPNNSINLTLDKERRVYPHQAIPVNRGYSDGVLDEEGKLKRFTSACGPVIYRGDQFPDEFYGNAFVCGPEANLIKRYLISEREGKIYAEPAYADSEFLVSREASFRPVNLYTGLDGALYIVDLRKGVIQHRAYMSSYLRDQTLANGLDTITGIGRIYKVKATEGPVSSTPDLLGHTSGDYLPLLEHPNGIWRSLAQQQLIFGEQRQLAGEIEKIAESSPSDYGRIHALWTLEGLDLLDVKILLKVADNSSSPLVIKQLLQLAQAFPAYHEALRPLYEKALALQDPKTDLQLCHTLALLNDENWNGKVLELILRYADNPVYAEAFISAIGGREKIWLERLLPNPGDPVTAAAQPQKVNTLSATSLISALEKTIDNRKNQRVQKPEIRTQVYLDNRTKGAMLYSKFCATCHGSDAKGVDGLAPALYESHYVTESAEKFILIVLHGMQGPVTVNGNLFDNNAIMPGVKNNPELDDDELAALLRFIANGFTSGVKGIHSEKVRQLRRMTEDREAMWTEETLNLWLKENLDEQGKLMEMVQ